MNAAVSIHGVPPSALACDHSALPAPLRVSRFSQSAYWNRTPMSHENRVQASGSGRGTQHSDADGEKAGKAEKDKAGQPFNKLVGSLLQNVRRPESDAHAQNKFLALRLSSR